MRRVLGAVLGVAVAMWCLPAIGVDTTLRFGRIAKLKDKDGTASDQVIVKFVKESGLIATLPNPMCPAASTIRLKTDLRGRCSSTSTAASGRRAAARGYSYKDKTGSAGGVTLIKFSSKPTGGKLLIKLKGDGYGVNADRRADRLTRGADRRRRRRLLRPLRAAQLAVRQERRRARS